MGETTASPSYMPTQKVTKYLTFRRVGRAAKATKWVIINTHQGTLLGEIKWYRWWRQYTLMPNEGMVFNAGCLQEIVAFIGELKAGAYREKG